MHIHITILFIGFTILSAGLLIFSYTLFLNDLQKSINSKIACALLLFGLASLQWFHYLTLTSSFDALSNRLYLICLMFVPASFYFFSRLVLFPNIKHKIHHLAHLSPTVAVAFFPIAIIPAIAFC